MSFCVECRWCQLAENSQERLSYWCERKREPLKWDVARKNACADFRPATPSSHWGP